ncbi:peptidase [Streptomyces cinereoruber]|uniref:LysM peptidoglycan-binding domain-containing protein n=2 Tax=Streptomyces cinereoruber TaxID=67260 RepID=A0AAV4KEU7_9ACTN|nr:LysM peptidoglycan-binding domain-containing M23 family metallopeptidase [Streptomyces cinereoruber]MBB4157849.1 murein DD-endopeptidase MepM/ murein hydrolase activator NlpD [Streptomyces cinereoruber]MBY8816237.1 LysM peptidoglycan-binding domain-containing M23 family metallopeptidase [Streptomyces cinereoruber]NIH61998.1 murein DD-endopeptidase MepM/ murein hydrolase activator NlpD [Streptomyces cinereoruber]QEV35708.1 LysM peptidoglycan-binding domain-containing protein [Streptomyces cin
MPAKGKHRRPKNNPLTRGFAAAGTGGAVVALPLLGATGAHAAEQTAPASASVQSVVAAQPVAAKAAAPAKAAPAKAAENGPRTYSVVPGDYLSKIAADHRLSGGWQRIYEDNRRTIGADPSLILPGMKLTIGAQGSVPTGPKSTTAAGKNGDDAPRASRESRRAAAPAATAPKAAEKSSTGSSSTGSTASSSGWVAPVTGGFSTPYRASGSMWSSGYHTGVDFIASSGTTVRAVGAGTVVSAGWSGSYGNEVVIQHADGNYSQYAHLSSLSVSAGQSVGGGQQIGLSGSTGNSTGPHLHFEIRTTPSYGSDVDPLAYLRQHGVSV